MSYVSCLSKSWVLPKLPLHWGWCILLMTTKDIATCQKFADMHECDGGVGGFTCFRPVTNYRLLSSNLVRSFFMLAFLLEDSSGLACTYDVEAQKVHNQCRRRNTWQWRNLPWLVEVGICLNYNLALSTTCLFALVVVVFPLGIPPN